MIKHAAWLSLLFAVTVHAAAPFGAPAAAPAPMQLATGPRTEIADGDFAYPCFSPDGRRLAFARSVVRDRVELTEIGLLDLDTGKQTTLLDANGSRKYAAYKSFVYRLSWSDNTHLLAAISDGDVRATAVTFDTRRGAVASERDLSGGDGAPAAPIKERMTRAFPTIPPAVLDNALRNGVALADGSFVVQKDYAGQDEHIWRLDPTHRQATRLVTLPDDWIHALAGGFGFDDTLVFLLQHGGQAYLLAYRNGTLQSLLQTRADGQQAQLEVKHADKERVIFMVYTDPPYRKSDNLLLVFDRAGLHRARDASPLADADIDMAGGRIAFTVWHGDRRTLRIQSLRRAAP